MRPMKILALVAGTNVPGNADTLADAFLEGAKAKGASVEKMRIANLDLAPFSLKFYDAETDQGADFERLKQAVLAADGILIATPIWNFSVPGHLKNLIDRLGSFCLDETHSVGTLKGRPCFLLYTGGSPGPAWTGLMRRTVSHLPVSLRYFGMVITGHHYEARCTPGRGKFALVVDKRPESQQKVRTDGAHFAEITSTYATTGKLPAREAFLLKAFQTAQKLKRKLGL